MLSRLLTPLYPTVVMMLFTTCVSRTAVGENASTDWQVRDASPTVQVERQPDRTEGDRTFTRFRLTSAENFQQAQLTLARPPALAIADFAASIEVNSTQLGLQLAVRMVLPHQIDPRTGQPLVTLLPGDRYETRERWETLRVSADADAIAARIRQLRTELNTPGINTKDAYFQDCVLLTEVHTGESFVDLALAEYGPVIDPPRMLSNPDTPAAKQPQRTVRIDREQLLVDDSPIYLRFMPDHGESPSVLKQLQINGAWIPDSGLAERIDELLQHQLLALATPPHPQFDPGDFSSPLQGLPPLEQVLPRPSIWYLGTSVAREQMPHLLAWSREVRSADRQLRRPIMADVEGGTDVASRQVDFIGLSRHRLGGRLPFGHVRNLSFVRRNTNAQVAFPWEWIQTEPSDDTRRWRTRTGSLPMQVEPEQILLQMAASLSGGSRAIGYWKTQTLDSAEPAAVEIHRAIELANSYVTILEPFLVDARVDGHISVSTSQSPSSADRYRADESFVDYDQTPDHPDGAVIQNGSTSVILVVHWDSASQFVPQSLFAPVASMTVAATETASAWHVTGTSVRGIRRQPTAGGLRIRINDFDLLTLVLVSADTSAYESLKQRIYANAERMAELQLELAELKLARVRETCHLIDRVIDRAPDTDAMFHEAAAATEAARGAMNRQDLPGVEKTAQQAMRITRQIQNRYWQAAVRNLPTPMASPHAVSFSTLPDHWKMISRLRTSPASENLVPSGSFDSLRLLSQGTWKPVSPHPEEYTATADVIAEPVSGDQVLRLRAYPQRRNRPPTQQPETTLLVSSPSVEAKAGDLFEITARIRLGDHLTSDSDRPLLIFDSDLGPEMAVNPTVQPSWRICRIYRQASETGPFKVWLTLQGTAEVYVDDVSIVRHRSDRTTPANPQEIPGN